MWFTLISSLFSFLGGPVAKALVQSYQAKLAAGNTSERIAADLAGKEIGAQQYETQAITQLKIAEIGHPWEPEKLAFYVTLVFYAKVMIWDKVLGSLTHGSTDPVTGAAGVWAGLIMSFYFAKRGFENVARIIKR
jgi:hypothetical protein